MAFDPKAYLAKSGGFDPRAYLDKVRSRQRADVLLNPRTGMPLDTSPDDVKPADLLVGNPDEERPGESPASMVRWNETHVPLEEKKAARRDAIVAGVGAVAGGGLGALFGPAAAGAGLLGRTAASTLAAAGTGEVTGATRAALEGKSGGDIADAAANEGSVSALIGGAGHLLGEGAAAIGNAVKGGKNWVGRYLRGKEAGAYEDPAMKSLPRGEKGIKQSAIEGHQRVVNRMEQQQAEAGGKYLQAYEANKQTPVDREKLLTRLRAERMDPSNINPDTGEAYSAAVDARYAKALADLGDHETVNTVEGTIGLRRGLQREANFGSPAATTEEKAAQKVYHSMRAAVRDASPEMAVADDAYAAHAKTAARNRDILYRNESPVTTNPAGEAVAGPGETDTLLAGGTHGPKAEIPAGETQMPVSKTIAGQRTLMREGDTNVPGLDAQQFLDELRARDPEFAAALDFIGNKKALEATRFGLETLPTSLHGATGHAGVGMLNVPISLIKQNARFAAAEGLYPALQAGGNLRLAAPFSGGAANPLFAPDERNRRRAETLLSGGHR